MKHYNSLIFQLASRKLPLLLVIIITTLSLSGWLFDNSIFNAFSSVYIPTAPLTAIILLVLSGFLLFRKCEEQTWISVTSVSIFIVFMICLLIFLSYILKLPWDIENVLIENAGRFGDVPKGRMSPITSILFIFICFGICGTKRISSPLLKYVGGGSSFVVFFISFILLIGYLYKAPFLYGSSIIPVALPTALCFLFFSLSLLLSYNIMYWTFGLFKENSINRQLISWFLPVVTIAVVFQGYITTNFTFNPENQPLTAAVILIIVCLLTILMVIRVSELLGNRIIKVEDALKNSETRLHTLLSAIPDLVWLKDKNGVFMSCNAAMERCLGAKEAEVIGKTDSDFVNNQLADYFRKNDLKAIEAGKPVINEDSVIFKDDGHSAILETIKVPMYYPDGSLIGVLGVGRDISARKKAEEDLVKAKEKAEESERLKSAFLANMSHEIRTPMNGIIGFAELLKEPDLTGDEKDEYITIIQKSGDRMLNIINDIISISKLESGLMQLTKSEANINDQINYIYTFFKPEAEQKGIRLIYNNALPFEEAVIFTDREKLYAILTNLVKNALKFTWNGSIEVGYTKVKNCIEFYVKDTGTGIPQEQLDIIFERFRQGSESLTSTYEGAGLGLSISKAYVEMMGGNIWVKSKLGKGSEFYFTLPYNQKEKEEETLNSVEIDNEEDNHAASYKILIAEDDELSAVLLKKTVKSFGRQILMVKEGDKVIETVSKHPDLDLILMDIQLPEVDGYEITRRIREFNKDVIIIAQTAFALPGDHEKAIEAGCNDYVSKPINQVQLREIIEKHLKIQMEENPEPEII